MQIMLLLTAEQAALVRGPSAIDPDAVLEPIALPDGRYALPAQVLDDPVHQPHHEMLGGVPSASMDPAGIVVAKRPRTVGIIGAGFSGTMLAVHLIEMSAAPLKVILFDRSSSFARGPAYATPNAKHLLNVRAANMSAYASDPEHFVRWLGQDRQGAAEPRTQDTFASRGTYGRYLRATLEAACLDSGSNAHVVEVAADVTRLEVGDESVRLSCEDGRHFDVDCVALCVGNLPQALPVQPGVASPNLKRYIAEPWVPHALAHIGPQDSVAIIGTGLTMIDVVLDLRSRGHAGNIVAVSRRGLLPVPHRNVDPYPSFLELDQTYSTKQLFALVLDEVRWSSRSGVDWRSVLDALRPQIDALWRKLSDTERRRFLRHVRPYWEIHRHRVAPTVDDEIQMLVRTGALSVIAGRIVSLASGDQSTWLGVRERASGRVREVTVNWLVNCSGPQLDYGLIRDPLLKSLFASGLAAADALNLGLQVSEDYRLVGREGAPAARLFAVGPPIRGTLWETTAVPDIRNQCEALARGITAQLADAGASELINAPARGAA